jgi:hypothetical protein
MIRVFDLIKEMQMNFKQQIVLCIAALAIACSFLIVPWATYVPLDTPEGNMAETQYDYRFFNSPPEKPLAIKPPHIVWMYPFQKLGIILLINATLLYLLRPKKRNRKSAYCASVNPSAAF